MAKSTNFQALAKLSYDFLDCKISKEVYDQKRRQIQAGGQKADLSPAKERTGMLNGFSIRYAWVKRRVQGVQAVDLVLKIGFTETSIEAKKIILDALGVRDE